MPKKKKVDAQPKATDEVPVLKLVKTARARKPQRAPEVMTMTDLETLRLGKLDAEVQRMQQAVGALEQAIVLSELRMREQLRELEDQHRAFKEKKAEEKRALIGLFNTKHQEYKKEVLIIAEKYGLDVNQFSYDPDTGVIRDLRNQPAEDNPPG